MPNSSFHIPYSLLSESESVSVIALCHNHAPFLREALDSILAQTYPHLEVWLVDDASTDGSPAILREYAARHPAWHLLLLPENVGNCRAFNLALGQSKGTFVIDFATDDVLLPERISRQVAAFQAAEPAVGIVTDCTDKEFVGINITRDADFNYYMDQTRMITKIIKEAKLTVAKDERLPYPIGNDPCSS